MLTKLQFLCLTLTVVGAPWFFGAWEMWCYWPFCTVLFLGVALTGARWMRGDAGLPALPRSRLLAVAGCIYLFFIGYAFVRVLQTPVRMTAERSFLALLSPVLAMACVAWGMDAVSRGRLWTLVQLNLVLLGLYGIINHVWTGSRRVMWANGFEQYWSEGRASGSYYCPDHYAGAMEMFLCGCLAVLLSRESKSLARVVAMAGILLALTGILLSKSRGGGLTVVVVFLAALWLGFLQWSRKVRRWHRLSALAVGGILLVAVWNAPLPYMQRFRGYFAALGESERPWRERIEKMELRFRDDVRGRMYAAALRAWRTEPVWGIGAGMHPHRWFEFAFTPDGDAATGQWPTQTNHEAHSMEVHNDWLQLMEEYGVVGLTLLSSAALVFFAYLVRCLYDAAQDYRRGRRPGEAVTGYADILAATLAFAALAFHSVGDFNLQIPANGWMLGVLVGFGATTGRRT